MAKDNYVLGGLNGKGLAFKQGTTGVTGDVDLTPTLAGTEKYRYDCQDSCKTACNGCMNGCEASCGTECGDGCFGSCRVGCFGKTDSIMTCNGCGVGCMGTCYSSCGECGGCSGMCHSSNSTIASVTQQNTSAIATSKCSGCGASCASNSTGNVTSVIKIGGGK